MRELLMNACRGGPAAAEQRRMTAAARQQRIAAAARQQRMAAAAEQQRMAAAAEQQRIAAAAAKVNFNTSDHLNFLVSVLLIHEVH